MGKVCQTLERHPCIGGQAEGKQHLQAGIHVVLLLLVVRAVHIHFVRAAQHRVPADIPHPVEPPVRAEKAARDVHGIEVRGKGHDIRLKARIRRKLQPDKAECAIPER